MSLKWKIAQAAEIRWWKNYLDARPVEEYLDAKRKYWRRVLSLMDIQLQEGERILDAGCGPAGIFMVLDQQRVDAVDPLLMQYEDLPHFQPADYPWTHFHPQTLESYEPATPYDRVFCLNAINHFHELRLSADRLWEATRAGGELLLSVDAHNYPLLKRLFRIFPGDILHPHQFDLAEYLRLFDRPGSKVEKIHCYKKQFIFNHYLLRISKGT